MSANRNAFGEPQSTINVSHIVLQSQVFATGCKTVFKHCVKDYVANTVFNTAFCPAAAVHVHRTLYRTPYFHIIYTFIINDLNSTQVLKILVSVVRFRPRHHFVRYPICNASAFCNRKKPRPMLQIILPVTFFETEGGSCLSLAKPSGSQAIFHHYIQAADVCSCRFIPSRICFSISRIAKNAVPMAMIRMPSAKGTASVPRMIWSGGT